EHHSQMTLAKECIPWRPVVVADDLVSRRRDESPSCLRRRVEALDEIVVATQQASAFGEVIVVGDPVRGRIGPARMHVAVDVLEYFAALAINPASVGRLESGALEESEQRMDRRSPWTGAPPDRVADARRVVQVPTDERH